MLPSVELELVHDHLPTVGAIDLGAVATGAVPLARVSVDLILAHLAPWDRTGAEPRVHGAIPAALGTRGSGRAKSAA